LSSIHNGLEARRTKPVDCRSRSGGWETSPHRSISGDVHTALAFWHATPEENVVYDLIRLQVATSNSMLDSMTG
jgi:hypothetical protein